MNLHDVPVLKHSAPVDADALIRTVEVDSLKGGVTVLGAEPLCVCTTRGYQEGLLASFACDGDTGGVVRAFATNGSQSRLFYLRKAGLSKAGARAEAHERFPYTVGPDIECLATLLAMDGDRHMNIVPQKQAVAISLNVARAAKKKAGKQ